MPIWWVIYENEKILETLNLDRIIINSNHFMKAKKIPFKTTLTYLSCESGEFSQRKGSESFRDINSAAVYPKKITQWPLYIKWHVSHTRAKQGGTAKCKVKKERRPRGIEWNNYCCRDYRWHLVLLFNYKHFLSSSHYYHETEHRKDSRNCWAWQARKIYGCPTNIRQSSGVSS